MMNMEGCFFASINVKIMNIWKKSKEEETMKDFIAIIMMGAVLVLERFFNIGITGMMTGFMLIYMVQAKILEKNVPEDMSKWFGVKARGNKEACEYGIEVMVPGMRKSAMISLCFMPLMYWFEFVMGESARIFDTFYLNRLLCGAMMLIMIMLLAWPVIRAEKAVNRKF